MRVTINTDASYHSGYKIGAFAFWIVCNYGKVCKSGILKETNSSHESELQCILNAMHCLKQQSEWIGLSHVIINTDSMNSIYLINNDKHAIKKYRLSALRDKYKTLIHNAKQNLPLVELRHVKAHTDTKDARSWVNDWCDKKAKEHLWKTINKKIF